MSDIIEIPSSPDSSSSRPLRRKRMPLFLPEREEQEVIEITDSESGTPRKKRKLEHGNEQPQAGPSNAINPQAATPAPRRGSTRPKTPSTSKQPAAGRADEQIALLDDAAASQVHLPERLTPPIWPPSSEPSLQSIVLDEEPPQEPEDPFQLCLAQVHEIVPDVLPEYVLQLIQTFEEKDDLVGEVLHVLFEDPAYPRIDSKGKAKAVLPERKAPSAHATTGEIDYSRVDRDRNGGPVYAELAREQLYVDFPDIPQVHVNAMLAVHLNLYAPAYLYLQKERRGAKLPYVPEPPKKSKRRVSAKKKGKRKAALHDAEFLRERQWLLAKLAQDAANVGKEPAVEVEGTSAQEIVEEVDGIECGCCFTEYPFDKMIQCEDAHLFCNECVISYASTKLGEHNPDICCMDQSGCKLPFPDSELRRILPEKLHNLYERVRQQREVEAACIEGLEECPFCEFKAVLEVDVESDKLFRCQNEECGRASCRKCKKEDHTPKSCQEMEEDKKLDGKHAIEEAMSRALMRNCPSCKKGFIKESGCNKMTCPNCRTLSCYVCRKIVTGYEHFQQNNTNGMPLAGASTSNKCPLWDPVEQRHADEVAAAAKKALDDYKREHPDIKEDEIKVDLPPPPAAAVGLQAPLFGAVGVLNHAHAPPYQHLIQAAAPGMPRMPAPPPQPPAPPVGPQHFWHIFPANPDIQGLQRRLQEGQQADVFIQQQVERQLQQAQQAQLQRQQAQAQRQALHRERQEALARRQQQLLAEQQARLAQQEIQLQVQQLRQQALLARRQAAMRQAPAPIAVAPKAVRRKRQ